MGALAIDDKKYARVLAKVLPRVIANAREHGRLLAEVEKLMDKGERRSNEEDAASTSPGRFPPIRSFSPRATASTMSSWRCITIRDSSR